MKSINEKQVIYFIIPYIFLNTTIISLCSFLLYLADEFRHPNGLSFAICMSVIVIVYFTLFRLTVCRLPDVSEKQTSEGIKKRPQVFFPIVVGVVCSLLAADAIELYTQNPIGIAQISDIKKYPNEEYFYVDSIKRLPSNMEAFYYLTTKRSNRGPLQYNIKYFRGGNLEGMPDIYFFSSDVYYVGTEYTPSSILERSKFALSKENEKFNTFLEQGGYIKRMSSFQRELINSKVYNISKSNWFKTASHFGVVQDPNSESKQNGMYVLVLALLSSVISISTMFLPTCSSSLRVVEKENGYFNRIFKHKLYKHITRS
ncbi:hypothetical protein ACQEXU_21225 [Vibrio sp. TRT 21S02]|uniref:hypothetical protein n=1 Tax=Vibrio sp. TRT 21S02 TaxID=3418507 RepID=UPI003CEAC83F